MFSALTCHSGKETGASQIKDQHMHLEMEASRTNIRCKADLDSHQEQERKHDEEKHLNEKLVHNRFKCDLCEKSYRRKSDLKRHKQIHHAAQEGQNSSDLHCSLCSKKYVSKTSLRVHLKRHLEKTFFVSIATPLFAPEMN